MVTYKRNIPSCSQYCVAGARSLARTRGFHELILMLFPYPRRLPKNSRGHITNSKRQEEPLRMDENLFTLHGIDGLAVPYEDTYIGNTLLGWYGE